MDMSVQHRHQITLLLCSIFHGPRSKVLICLMEKTQQNDLKCYLIVYLLKIHAFVLYVSAHSLHSISKLFDLYPKKINSKTVGKLFLV